MRFYEIIAAETAEKSGLIKPQKPLTIPQLQRRQEKNFKTQKQIRDVQAKTAQKLSDLRIDLE